jgi:hypothetical protein
MLQLNKKTFIVFLFILIGASQSWGQMLAVKAMADFYDVYGRMEQDGKSIRSPGDIKDHLTAEIRAMLIDNLAYRVAFIGQLAARYGFNTGVTNLNNIDGTINAMTGFLMLVEGNGDIKAWTVKEVSDKYERMMQTSWQNTNPTLFMVMLETYCAYRRRELGW